MRAGFIRWTQSVKSLTSADQKKFPNHPARATAKISEIYDDGADRASVSNIRRRQADPILALCGEFTGCSHCILDLLTEGHRLFGDGCEELVNDVSRDSGEHSLTHSCHCPPHLGFSGIYHLRIRIL